MRIDQEGALTEKGSEGPQTRDVMSAMSALYGAVLKIKELVRQTTQTASLQDHSVGMNLESLEAKRSTLARIEAAVEAERATRVLIENARKIGDSVSFMIEVMERSQLTSAHIVGKLEKLAVDGKYSHFAGQAENFAAQSKFLMTQLRHRASAIQSIMFEAAGEMRTLLQAACDTGVSPGGEIRPPSPGPARS